MAQTDRAKPAFHLPHRPRVFHTMAWHRACRPARRRRRDVPCFGQERAAGKRRELARACNEGTCPGFGYTSFVDSAGGSHAVTSAAKDLSQDTLAISTRREARRGNPADGGDDALHPVPIPISGTGRFRQALALNHEGPRVFGRNGAV
jgi:hypothetical protein